MWIKNILTAIGAVIAAIFFFLLGRRRKGGEAGGAPPSPPPADQDPAIIAERQRRKESLMAKVKEVEKRHKEASNEETISDLINKHNDLYND